MAYDESTIEVLKSDVRELREQIDGARSHVDILYRAVAKLQPSPEFAASELISIGPGPAGVAFTIQETPGDLVASVDRMNAKAEAAGSVVESVQFQTNFTNAHAAFITYRLPVPETEAANG